MSLKIYNNHQEGNRYYRSFFIARGYNFDCFYQGFVNKNYAQNFFIDGLVVSYWVISSTNELNQISELLLCFPILVGIKVLG